MIILIRAAVYGTNTTYVCYYDLTRRAMSGSKRQRVTPQQRDDFATCSASEQQWLERNSKMTIAGCNEELGFPIAQVDEVMHMVMHTYIMMHMLILQVWGWFQQLTMEHNLTRKFTAHDFCMALKQHHTYRAKSQCRQLDINTHFYSVECNETVFKKRVMPCLYRIAEVLRAYRPQIIKPLDKKQGRVTLGNGIMLSFFPSMSHSSQTDCPMSHGSLLNGSTRLSLTVMCKHCLAGLMMM